MAHICGKTEENIMDNGLIMICQELVSTFTLMVSVTTVNTSTIKRKALVYIIGPMVVNTKVGGIKENNMDLEHILTALNNQLNTDCGSTENV